MDRQKRRIIHIGMLAALVLALATFSFAEGVKEVKKEKIETTSVAKEVQGEISGISKDSISIVYQRDVEKGVEYEIFLPMDKYIKLVHKKGLKELNVGDIVSVQYEEVTQEHKEGPKHSRMAKIISFVKPAVKKPEPVKTGTPVSNSGALGEERFPIKGIKGQ